MKRMINGIYPFFLSSEMKIKQGCPEIDFLSEQPCSVQISVFLLA